MRVDNCLAAANVRSTESPVSTSMSSNAASTSVGADMAMMQRQAPEPSVGTHMTSGFPTVGNGVETTWPQVWYLWRRCRWMAQLSSAQLITLGPALWWDYGTDSSAIPGTHMGEGLSAFTHVPCGTHEVV